MSKMNRLANYLQSGSEATPKQIQKMFKISNPSAAIYTLRSKGMLIYANSATLKDGTETVKYKIGKPTKNMVKALHSLGFFN